MARRRNDLLTKKQREDQYNFFISSEGEPRSFCRKKWRLEGTWTSPREGEWAPEFPSTALVGAGCTGAGTRPTDIPVRRFYYDWVFSVECQCPDMEGGGFDDLVPCPEDEFDDGSGGDSGEYGGGKWSGTFCEEKLLICGPCPDDPEDCTCFKSEKGLFVVIYPISGGHIGYPCWSESMDPELNENLPGQTAAEAASEGSEAIQELLDDMMDSTSLCAECSRPTPSASW
jgi:hypothetical protein